VTARDGSARAKTSPAIHRKPQRALSAYLTQSGHGAKRESLRFLAAPRRERRKPLTRRPASARFHRHAGEAGLLLGITPHRTRATFITEALDCNCLIEAVQTNIGHRPIATAQKDDPRTRHDRERASFAVQCLEKRPSSSATLGCTWPPVRIGVSPQSPSPAKAKYSACNS